jgi:hypothetical protein
MSSDYDVRVRRPFTVVEVHETSQHLLSLIIPRVEETGLEVRLWPDGWRDRFELTPPAPTDFLTRVHGSDSPLVPDYLIMTSGAEGIAGVSDSDIGYPEDPDGGRRLNVTRHFQRLAPSYFLGIVVITAAAILTGSPVVDEYAVLTGERLTDPEHIIERLSLRTHTGPFEVLAASALEAARIN